MASLKPYPSSLPYWQQSLANWSTSNSLRFISTRRLRWQWHRFWQMPPTAAFEVVAETHSSLLLLGIQSLVAEGKLFADKVKLHWFKRRPEDGVTEVSSADLDKAGAFGDWPEDFSSAEMDADTRYIHAAEARLESN